MELYSQSRRVLSHLAKLHLYVAHVLPLLELLMQSGNTVSIKCEPDGTLDVDIRQYLRTLDVIVDNIVPVSASGTWTVNLHRTHY